MARKQSSETARLVQIALAIVFIGWLASNMPARSAVPFVVLVVAAAAAGLGARAYMNDRWTKRAQLLVAAHAQDLAVRRSQLLGRKSYGVVDAKPWTREVDRFLNTVVAPVLGDISSKREGLHALVNRVADGVTLNTAFHPAMHPSDYERFVAGLLTSLGWAANVSGKTGDQGVDVLANKGRVRLVVQCKLFSGSVGNAAVQEAISGRAWASATHCIVVSNAKFTRSAEYLAAKAGVLLLHHDQLTNLDALLGAETATA